MPGPWVIGIDIGTESGRAAAFTLDGRAAAFAAGNYPLYTPEDGWAEQDPADWWRVAVTALRALAEQGIDLHRITAIGVCGQMHGPVPVSAGGEPCSPRVPLWCDKRSEAVCHRVGADMPPAEQVRLTGNRLLPNWAGPKIAWIREHWPDVYRQAHAFLMPKDYVNLRLTGIVATDRSEASGTFLAAPDAASWSPWLAGALGVDPDKLPPIYRSFDVIGRVTSAAAAETGLRAGIPVVAGGGDMLCLLLGAGLVLPGLACDVAGTAADISVFVPEPLRDQRVMNLHHVADGWIAFGLLDSGGASLQWFKEHLAGGVLARAKAEGTSVYRLLDQMAAAVPAGAEGLLFLPYLLGERTLGTPASRGSFIGLRMHHGLGHMVRAVLEGVALDLRMTLEIVRELGHGVSSVRAIGGGARSDLWCQIKSDIYRAPVTTLQSAEGGALGAALLAAVGTGVYPDLQVALEQMVQEGRTYQPNAAAARQYDRSFALFRELHDVMQPYYPQLRDLAGPSGGS